MDQECEMEKLKSKLYFLEADLSEVKLINEQLQKETKSSNDEMLSPDLKDISDIKTSESSESPERFEIIDKNMSILKNNDLDDISNNSFNTSDWTKINIPEKDSSDDFIRDPGGGKEQEFDDLSLEPFTKEVFSLCYVNIGNTSDNEFTTILNENINVDNLIHIVAKSLLKVIPNILLNKREEIIPLLMAAIYLNPKVSERDKLLQQLFNLKKKPTEKERLIILSGVVGIAKYAGEQLVENEILPQCWLQLTHKYVERRLLVVEACTALIPYVSSPIRNSLILSMLQQMLEDKEEAVREQTVKALALLISMCEDQDKYSQCEQISIKTLNDSGNSVIIISTQILFPVLARWALHSGHLQCSLLKKLLHRLNDHIKSTESQMRANQGTDKIQRILSVIDILLPFLLISVTYHENVISNIEKDMTIEIRSDIYKLCTSLTNPEKILKSDLNIGTVLYEFDKYVCDNPSTSWSEMDWVVDIMIPDLFNNLHHIEQTQQQILEGFMNLFSHVCVIFGKNFTKFKILPILHKKIQNLEQVISSFNQFCPSLNIIPLYFTALHFTGDYEEISSVFKKFLCALPLCGTPLDCLEITVRTLCEAGLQEMVVDCLWSGVVHQRHLVKSASASLFCTIIGNCSEELLKSNVTGALVTLASDNDVLVRTATIPALGSLITNCEVKEIHDKAYMQLQTFINDHSLRENHTLLRQLVVTLGDIVNSSSSVFRNDVIIPQLTNLSMFMSQMSNQTRKIDMALALIEAFTHVVYSPLNKQSISSIVKPGLRCLDSVISENQSLSVHHETVLSMIRECENKSDVSTPSSPVDRGSKLGQNVNQGVEEMRQRMSKIFNKPSIGKSNTLPNLQGIFKKK